LFSRRKTLPGDRVRPNVAVTAHLASRVFRCSHIGSRMAGDGTRLGAGKQIC